MFVSKLFFENFRNFSGLDLLLNQGFIVLVGPNGAGKTNFLEGIYVGSSLRHFPDSRIGQLFKIGEPFFRIKITTQANEEKTQELYLEKQGKSFTARCKMNGVRSTKGKYAGLISIISFVPLDLILLTHSPRNRRRFLNEALSNVSAEYRLALRNYSKALRQRNNLWEKVKIGEKPLAELLVWNEPLAEFGSVLTKERQDFIDYLNQSLGVILDKLSPELKETRFLYRKSGEASRERFLQKLEMTKQQEQQIGQTLIGPHRDDFSASLEGLEVVGYFSRGQMRSLTLALKITEREYIREKRGELPILLLDDVFSEFDKIHQEKLAEFLKSLKQVFVSTTHLEEVQAYLPPEAQIFKIEAGQVIA